MTRPVIILGAGGHAKVVVATLRAAGRTVQGCAVLGDPEPGATVLGVPVLSEAEIPAGCDLILGTGDNALRKRLAGKFAGPWATAIHPAAVVDPSVQMGGGSVVCAGVVIQADARIGSHAIVNTHASVDHDCVLGDFVHVAPGVHLAGQVKVGEGVLVGVGASAIPGVDLGAWSVVGAGAAVVRNVAPGSTVGGVPARVLKS